VPPAVAVAPFHVAEPPPAVRGFLHRPVRPSGDGLVLTHGAGGNCRDPLLVAVAGALAAEGLIVLRCDLPYRQARPSGPPAPAGAARDRHGLRRALEALRPLAPRRLFLGGKSYGGRQASLLAAEDPELASGLLLLSYPLHPPARPEQRRTDHFAKLRLPILFVHGSRDPFGAVSDLDAARKLIPARTALLVVEGGHDLGFARGKSESDLPAKVVAGFRDLAG
jgi:predicted alpha/beta-hydrolase family hydrolase